ncbi:MAG: hypothetical protein ABIO38_08115 [Luteimonas sp.]
MKTSQPFVVAMTCFMLAAGCNRAAQPETAPAAEAAAPATAVTDVPEPVAEKPFMPKAFAGSFSVDGNTIVLNADGTYTSKMDGASSDGTWTADAAGAELLLDPNSKSEVDGRYTVVSHDEISALDGGMRLQREQAAR